VRLFFLRNAKLFELFNHVLAMVLGFDLLIDELYHSFLVDIKSPSFGEWPPLVNDTIRFGDFLVRVTEDGVLKLQGFGERLVPFIAFVRVTACREKCYIKLLDLFRAVTQRAALGRSAACKRFREPSDDDGLFALELGEAVLFAIRTLQFEIWCLVASFDALSVCVGRKGQNQAGGECREDQLHDVLLWFWVRQPIASQQHCKDG
jgi:hypothetical protein